jgi:hypothetical protein
MKVTLILGNFNLLSKYELAFQHCPLFQCCGETWSFHYESNKPHFLSTVVNSCIIAKLVTIDIAFLPSMLHTKADLCEHLFLVQLILRLTRERLTIRSAFSAQSMMSAMLISQSYRRSTLKEAFSEPGKETKLLVSHPNSVGSDPPK